MKKKMEMKKIFVFFVMGLIIFPLVSAGVGISWNQESSLIPEKSETCLTYKVYNPWPEDSYAQIKLSDELMPIVSSFEVETKFIPSGTSSSEAIPISFCFETPRVYEADCLLFGTFLCKQECGEEMKIYKGEVEILEAAAPEEIKKGQGSATAMSVSAPLNIKVQCLAHDINYSFIYIVVGLIAGILLVINFFKKKKNSAKKFSKKKRG